MDSKQRIAELELVIEKQKRVYENNLKQYKQGLNKVEDRLRLDYRMLRVEAEQAIRNCKESQEAFNESLSELIAESEELQETIQKLESTIEEYEAAEIQKL